MMRSLGIDLAAEPPDTAACEIIWLADGARGRVYTDRLDDDRLLALIESADKVGIDCPFGWPQSFVDAVASMPTPQSGPAVANSARATGDPCATASPTRLCASRSASGR